MTARKSNLVSNLWIAFAWRSLTIAGVGAALLAEWDKLDQPATKVEEGKEAKAHPDQDKEVKDDAGEEAPAAPAPAPAPAPAAAPAPAPAAAPSSTASTVEGEEKQE